LVIQIKVLSLGNINYQSINKMRNLAVIIVILLSQVVKSQESNIDFLIPVKTFHFSSQEKHRYAPGEGGNLGLIVSFSRNRHKINSVYSAGYIKNSYGKWSMIATYGKSYNATDWLRLEVNVGIATNYSDAYYRTYYFNPDTQDFTKQRQTERDYERVHLDENLSKKMSIFYDYGLLPVGALTAKVKVKKWAGFAINVNPYYVNAAVMITLN